MVNNHRLLYRGKALALMRLITAELGQVPRVGEERARARFLLWGGVEAPRSSASFLYMQELSPEEEASPSSNNTDVCKLVFMRRKAQDVRGQASLKISVIFEPK